MKKLSFSFILVLAFVAIRAQIPNPGFESWTNMSSYENPVGWSCPNDLTSTQGIYTCTKSTIHTQGNYSLKVQSLQVPLSTAVIAGYAASGQYDIHFAPIHGFPWTTRPLKLTGSWQYTTVSIDTGFIAVFLSRWDTIAHHRDTVAFGRIISHGTTSTWVTFNCNLTYFSTSNPDTGWIYISASGAHAQANSFTMVDNISFSGTYVGLDEPQLTRDIKIYPNPSTNYLDLETGQLSKDNYKIQIIDMQGRIIREDGIILRAGMNTYRYQYGDLPRGIYLLKMASANNSFSKKIIVR